MVVSVSGNFWFYFLDGLEGQLQQDKAAIAPMTHRNEVMDVSRRYLTIWSGSCGYMQGRPKHFCLWFEKEKMFSSSAGNTFQTPVYSAVKTFVFQTQQKLKKDKFSSAEKT